MVPESSRAMLHLEIGRVMRKRLREMEDTQLSGKTMSSASQPVQNFADHYLCSTVDQLNRGKDIMTDNSEIVELLLMNISAAKLSSLGCSWTSALSYLEQIIPSLQREEHWEQRYKLCLRVYTMHAEINISLSNFEAARSTINTILENGKSIDDTCELRLLHLRPLLWSLHAAAIDDRTATNKFLHSPVDAYALLMRLLNILKENDESLRIASNVLHKLGIEACVWLHQGQSAEKDKFRHKIKKLVKKQSWKKLIHLQPMKDERKLKVSSMFVFYYVDK